MKRVKLGLKDTHIPMFLKGMFGEKGYLRLQLKLVVAGRSKAVKIPLHDWKPIETHELTGESVNSVELQNDTF